MQYQTKIILSRSLSPPYRSYSQRFKKCSNQSRQKIAKFKVWYLNCNKQEQLEVNMIQFCERNTFILFFIHPISNKNLILIIHLQIFWDYLCFKMLSFIYQNKTISSIRFQLIFCIFIDYLDFFVTNKMNNLFYFRDYQILTYKNLNLQKRIAQQKVTEFLKMMVLLYFMRQNEFVKNYILNQVSKIQMKGVANQINPQNTYIIEKKPITTRQGDWVCLNCNNWNFSFRKFCNRCKYQSRQNNHISSFYIYYYTNNCQLQQKAQAQESDTNYGHFIVTPPKKIHKFDSKQKSDKKLPSVSPLIKKYKASKAKNMNSTTFEQNSQIYSNTQDDEWGSMQRDFTAEQDTRDEIQLYDSSDEYLENIISKIMI